jgi:NTP pyrophosphatase (non-canonical NTP hydrolase)
MICLKTVDSVMTNLEMAIRFRQAMEQQIGTNSPVILEMQESLIEEEYKEFIAASAEEYFYNDDDTNVLKELTDLVFVCYQYAATRGWDLDEAMRRIYYSNMSKLDDQGKPIRRNDGKILKGPNYQKPDLDDLI